MEATARRSRFRKRINSTHLNSFGHWRICIGEGGEAEEESIVSKFSYDHAMPLL